MLGDYENGRQKEHEEGESLRRMISGRKPGLQKNQKKKDAHVNPQDQGRRETRGAISV